MKDNLQEHMRTYKLEKTYYEIGGSLYKQFGKSSANTLERDHILMIYVDHILLFV